MAQRTSGHSENGMSLLFVRLLSLALVVLAAIPQAFATQTRNRPVRSLPGITARADFDSLSRTYYRGRFYALPHVMFVIDRQHSDRVYYVNSKLFAFHKDFVNAHYLSLERGRVFYENNYSNNNRRFLLGTVAYQTTEDAFTFEFWEGDRLTGKLVGETYKALSGTFFTALRFKPNSTGHEDAASEASVPSLTPAGLAANNEYQPLNHGTGIGQLRILESVTADTVIDRNQIVIFKESPVQLTPLSGIIITEPASPLSHANLLAKSWGIPNAQIKNADRLFKQLEGKYVRLEVGEHEYKLEPADPREVTERNRQWVKRTDLMTPRADLRFNRLADLKSLRARDSIRVGAKAANLGELINARRPAITVPPGFAVPFHFYHQFIQSNGLEERLASASEEDRFVHDPVYRKRRLGEMREWITAGRHRPEFAEAVLNKVHHEYGGKGLFVRSSTNAEDLPTFSGAGLYTTVPNVRSDQQLLEAIKAVWASIWNYEAYEARESFGMNHLAVYPGVLIQEGIDADSAGVAITTDPFDPSNRSAVYLNAKRGLGIKVVEGRRVAEQVLYRPDIRAIQVLTRSAEDSMLVFDELGGVREIAIEGNRSVLTDAMVRRLAGAALQIKKVFRGRDQDIEWLFQRGKLFIVQSRPYVRSSGP
jgi:hypothetical protein